MGYYSRFTGRVDINPPLPWKVFKDSPSHSGPNFDSDVRLVVEEERVDTEEGVTIKRRAVAIVPASEDGFPGYDMEEHLQDIVDLALGTPLVTVFTGHIEATGADGEQWRIKVVDGHVRRFEPVVTWPPESE